MSRSDGAISNQINNIMKQTKEDRLISEAYCSMSKSENAEDTSGNVSYQFNVDNMVCPLDSNELSQMVDKHSTVKMRVLGDAPKTVLGDNKAGNNISSFTISGPLKDVQSLASELSELPGIELGSEDNEETNMGDKAERTEVGIALKIFKAKDMNEVKRLAQELLKMHGQNLKMPSQNLPSIYNRKFTNPVHGPENTRVYKKYHSNEWHG